MGNFVEILGLFYIGYWFRIPMTDEIVNVQGVDASSNCWTIVFGVAVAVASFDVVADVDLVDQICEN